MKRIILALGVAILTLTGCNNFSESVKWGYYETLLKQVNTHYQNTHPAEVRSFWDDAAYHTGNMEYFRLTGDQKALDYSYQWAKYNNWMGASCEDSTKWEYKTYGEDPEHVLFGDWQICFQTYVDLYRVDGDSTHLNRALQVMYHQMRTPQHDYWWWADALYMVMPVMTRLYTVTNDELFLDKLYEYHAFADSLFFDREENLYFRDAKYVYPQHKTENGKKDFWARGNGWVLAGLARVLTDMPKEYKHRAYFEQRFKDLAEAVCKCAIKEKDIAYWTRSMLDPEQAPGYETSGTAFFTYGILWGVNNGILDDSYFKIGQMGWEYLSTIAFQEDKTIGYVQPIGERAIPGQSVNQNSQANFGTGAFLLAGCEYVRHLINIINQNKQQDI